MSSSEDELDAITDVLIEVIKIQVEDLQRKKIRKKRERWVRKWIGRREQYRASNTLLKELLNEDPTSYFNYLRINSEMFQWLLEKVTPKIQRQYTQFQDPITAELKLHVTLRWLATGNSLKTLEYYFRIPKCTINKFIPETLNAIYMACKEYLQVLKSESEWQRIIQGFSNRWNFPSCIGAIDGKHITITCPPGSDSNYYNYKGAFSIVLLAVVDDDYNFLCVDVGTYGSLADGGIFNKSAFKHAIENNKLNIPPGSVILGDKGFPLKTYLMKPFSQRLNLSDGDKIFNYRLSRAHRIVENAFGILTSRFRIFHSVININPKHVPRVVMTACALHNWIRKTTKSPIGSPISVDIEDTESGRIINGSWRSDPTPNAIRNLAQTDDRNPAQAAKNKRLELRNYFLSEGAVPWQYRIID